ncbi:hypothetical protein ALC62_12714 [Cyphomyrmex costatus]|uniref:Uncharacterized protein n=1 Tax=Cyphomyrmex costatus TaxID=456900 RepID=A0A151IAT9_9HYME|nr:hypothetical protein ALC62_12714 [Cyphomyrmex costatus]
MENHERVERELLEQCGRVATLAEGFAWMQRCDECIESLEELCRTKRPRLAVGHRQSAVARIARLAVLERVRGAIERHGSVKVNTAFNGEFIAGDKRTVMGINIKNCELYPTSNVREWYVSRGIEPMVLATEIKQNLLTESDSRLMTEIEQDLLIEPDGKLTAEIEQDLLTKPDDKLTAEIKQFALKRVI